MSDTRDTLLVTLLWAGVATVALTESLALFGLLNGWALLIGWGVVVGMWRGRSLRRSTRAAPRGAFAWGMLSGIGVIAALTALAAVLAPVNNWDSMTYHLPRVMRWLQSGTLAHWPTSMPRQLFQNPLAEYAILHTMALTDTDRLANLVQWSSFIGAALAVSTIARQLGADPRGQWLSAVWVMAMPMAILQASGTQNDLVAAFWLAVLVWAMLRDVHAPSWRGAAEVGVALGLLTLSKGTGYVLAFPFVVGYGVTRLMRRERGLWPTVGALAMAAALFVALNSGHYARNWHTFGNPLGATEGYAHETFSPAVTVSTALRNATLNATLPNDRLNYLLFFRPVRWLHNNVLGLDLGDPRTTYLDLGYQYNYINASEDTAPSPTHLFLLALAVGAFVLRRDVRRRPLLWAYLVGLVSVYVLFSALFKWQIWNVRLLMPLFIVAGAWIAAVTSDMRGRGVVGWALLLLAMPYLFLSCNRPLISADVPPFTCNRASVFDDRIAQVFNSRGGVQAGYIAAADAVNARGCDTVALALGGDSWEYPLWWLIAPLDGGRVQMGHVNVTNVTAALPDEGLAYCALVASPPLDASPVLAGITWHEAGRWGAGNDGTAVYFPQE